MNVYVSVVVLLAESVTLITIVCESNVRALHCDTRLTESDKLAVPLNVCICVPSNETVPVNASPSASVMEYVCCKGALSSPRLLPAGDISGD